MFSKSFQTRIVEANKVFVSTLEKLKSVQIDILGQISDNNSHIQKLKEENTELETMNSKAERQIVEIEKIVG